MLVLYGRSCVQCYIAGIVTFVLNKTYHILQDKVHGGFLGLNC